MKLAEMGSDPFFLPVLYYSTAYRPSRDAPFLSYLHCHFMRRIRQLNDTHESRICAAKTYKTYNVSVTP